MTSQAVPTTPTIFDFSMSNHGSVILLRALTPAAHDWVEENLSDDFNGAVEPRFIAPIVDGFTEEGLTWH